MKIELAGVERPIDFGLNTFIQIAEEEGTDMNDVLVKLAPKDNSVNVKIFRSLLYWSLYYGEVRLAKEQNREANIDFDVLDVGDWATELLYSGGAEEVFTKMAETMPQGEKKPKKQKSPQKTS